MNLLVLGLLLAFASPLLLWPIEQIFPWPFIVEEMVKAFIVILIANHQIKWPIIAGLLFSLSETVFYLFNFFKLANFDDFFTRIIMTTTLHLTTILIIYLGALKRPWGLLIGFILAVLIHYFFNSYI